MESMRTFLLRPLPAGLEPLATLALDLPWVWSHAGDAVWRLVNPDIWDRTQNPWVTLQECPQVRLNKLAQDPAFQDDILVTTARSVPLKAEASWPVLLRFACPRVTGCVPNVKYPCGC